MAIAVTNPSCLALTGNASDPHLHSSPTLPPSPRQPEQETSLMWPPGLNSRDKFAESTVSTGPAKVHDPAVRDSEVAMLEADDEVLRCIEARARALQGWRPRLRIERLQLQRYGPAGHYKHHFDWHGGRGVDRISSFLVYVDANCTGGGTEFPRLGIESETLTRGEGRRWCQFVECDEDGNLQGAGVTFRPVRGNAVYWENLRADGEGYQETWHAGLPVLTGRKVGLNIWSWYQF